MLLNTITPPTSLWRIGRQTNPIWFNVPVGIENIASDTAGERFDFVITPFGTLYAATTLEGAYAEKLMPLMPDPDAVGLLPDDDSIGPGCVDANWRATHRVCQVELSTSTEVPSLDFVDLTDAHNLAEINRELRPALAQLGVARLNMSVVTSSRRSVTHLIAEYVAAIRDSNGRRRFAGIKYMSKHGAGYECWAIFGGVTYAVSSETVPNPGDDDLRRIAKRYGLVIH